MEVKLLKNTDSLQKTSSERNSFQKSIFQTNINYYYLFIMIRNNFGAPFASKQRLNSKLPTWYILTKKHFFSIPTF